MVTEKMAYSTNEAAKLLSVSPDTIRELVHTKRLVARSAGRKFVIPRKSIEDWLSGVEQRNGVLS